MVQIQFKKGVLDMQKCEYSTLLQVLKAAIFFSWTRLTPALGSSVISGKKLTALKNCRKMLYSYYAVLFVDCMYMMHYKEDKFLPQRNSRETTKGGKKDRRRKKRQQSLFSYSTGKYWVGLGFLVLEPELIFAQL